jgi:hypothetical protein
MSLYFITLTQLACDFGLYVPQSVIDEGIEAPITFWEECSNENLDLYVILNNPDLNSEQKVSRLTNRIEKGMDATIDFGINYNNTVQESVYASEAAKENINTIIEDQISLIESYQYD